MQFLAILGFAVLIRFPVYGEWNYNIDDQYYALVGQRMLDGDLLYVDIWDRKGPALYLTFSTIALISRSVIAYQLVATLSAAFSGFLVNRLALRIATPKAALLAGFTYCALLGRFEGDNAEVGVFSNSFLLFAAWSILSRLERLRKGQTDPVLIAGFLACGIAISYKQNAAFEGIAFGLFVVWQLLRAGCTLPAILRKALPLIAAGAAPSLLTAGYYAAIGHFPELWSATVESNLYRGYADPAIRIRALLVMAGMLGLPLLIAGIGVHARRHARRNERDILAFALLWLAVAITVIGAFPNVYVHYAQSVLAPLSLVCACYFCRPRAAWVGSIALIAVSCALSGSFHLGDRWRAKAAARDFVAYVDRETPGRKLFVWGNPNFLYAKLAVKPPSVLAFAPHMYEGREWTGHDEIAELRRVLDSRPETLVSQFPIQAAPLNETNVRSVAEYVQGCARMRKFVIYDHNGPQTQTVYSQCG